MGKQIPFYFKEDISSEEIIKLINEKFPISIRNHEDLINRIYDRYPVVDKATIAIVVQNTFTCMREQLILGKKLTISSMFINMFLLFFAHSANKRPTPAFSARLKTPDSIKYARIIPSEDI